jgi:hypothetical protein
MADIGVQVGYGTGQPPGKRRVAAQQVVSVTFRGARANAWQFGQFFNKLGEGFG